MKYGTTVTGQFISRPNRFIAEVLVGGEVKICHVKNTGRCKELLTKGARVILEKSSNPARRTEYDLIAVYKGDILINIDSQAPNKVFYEFARRGGFLDGITLIKPEQYYGKSRFDLYLERGGERIFAEVKGVTLEENGVLMFPDAPTERGVKHVKELMSAVKDGYKAYIVFVIQTEECKYFTPNIKTHPEFAEALKNASENGVEIMAYTCCVSEDSLEIKALAEVKL